MNDAANGDAANYKVNNKKTKKPKAFEYKAKIIVRTPANRNALNTERIH